MRNGFFITFEGGEGAGKSMQVEILASHLREVGYDITVTREPGGTRIGEQIRSITHNSENVDLNAKAEAYLMAASRAQHVVETIMPALETNRIVICDRFVDSSIVYQGYGRNLGADKIAALNEMAVNGATPDITFLLDIDPVVGAKRQQAKKNKDRLDMQQTDFYTRVRNGYQTLVKQNKKRFVVIDANQSIEKIATKVWQVVQKKIKEKEYAKKII